MSGTWTHENGVVHRVDVTETTSALDLEGEFDLVEAPALFEYAQRLFEHGRNVIVNLSEATFIDSSVIHALFKADAAARASGRVMVLQCNTHAGVERVLSITKTDEKFPTANTRAEAIHIVQQLADSKHCG